MDLKTQKTEVARLVNEAKSHHATLEAKRAKGEAIDQTDSDKLNAMIAAGQAARKDLDSLEALAALSEGIETPAEERKSRDTPVAASGEYKSPGARFIESKSFESVKSGTTEKGTLKFDDLSIKAILGETAGSGGNLIRADRQPEIVEIIRMRPPSIIDLINRAQTSLNSVDYVRLTARTDTTAIVAEGAAKPEGDLTTDVITVAVKVIAEWMHASKQILDDAPRLKNMIDNELMYMVNLKLENVIITDMLATAGIQARVHKVSGRGFTGTDYVGDTIRRALTDIGLEFYEADGIVMNPGDAETMELQRATGDGQYLHVFDPIAQRVWRKPVIETPAIAAGTAIVGNFKLGYTLWDRMQAAVQVGYVNDDFIKNLVTILCELRAAYGTIRPKAIEKITALNT